MTESDTIDLFDRPGQAALCWVAGTDPTGGMEYVTEKAMAEHDPSKERNLAKALLQERANIKDFICQVRRRSHHTYMKANSRERTRVGVCASSLARVSRK